MLLMKTLSSAGCAPANAKAGSYTLLCVDSALPFVHSLGCQTETHGCSIPKVLCSAKSAAARSHKSQSKSEKFMPAICIAGILFSCRQQRCVQCTSPNRNGSFDMLLNGNSFSADLVSHCIQKCCEEAATTVKKLQQ